MDDTPTQPPEYDYQKCDKCGEPEHILYTEVIDGRTLCEVCYRKRITPDRLHDAFMCIKSAVASLSMAKHELSGITTCNQVKIREELERLRELRDFVYDEMVKFEAINKKDQE